MIIFDSAYTVKILRERNGLANVTGRDLGGWFGHIWTIHPVASLVEGEDPATRYGPPTVTELAPRHTFIEGKVGRYAALRRFAALNYLLSLWSLYRVIARVVRTNGMDLIRAEDPLLSGLLAWLVAQRWRLPLLVGVWGNPGAVRAQTGQPLMKRLFRSPDAEARLERFVLARADLVMAQNEDNRRFCIAQGVKPERTVIFRLGNLLHAAHFTDPAARGDGAAKLAEVGVGGPCLIVIARLEPLKLVDHVVRAVAHLRDGGQTVTAILVGDGSGRDALVALTEELGVAHRVKIIGNRSQDWLVDVIPAVTMVVSPLTGRALAEAALGAVPIVAYDIDWHGELVEDRVTGRLVPYLEHAALGEAIGWVAADPARAKAMGAELRRRTLAMMDPTAANRAQIAAYESLLEKRAS